MAESVIKNTNPNPVSVVNGAIKSVTISKVENGANYLPSGIDATSNIIIAAYESANVVGAVISLGRNGDSIFAYAYSADGKPYTGSLTVTIYYIPIA